MPIFGYDPPTCTTTGLRISVYEVVENRFKDNKTRMRTRTNVHKSTSKHKNKSSTMIMLERQLKCSIRTI